MQGATEVGGSPKTASHQAQGNNHLRALLGLECLLQALPHGCCQEALLLSGTLRRQPESPHTQIVGWLLQSEWSSTEWAAPHTLYDLISKSHTVTFTFFCPFEEVQPTASGRGLDKGRYHWGLLKAGSHSELNPEMKANRMFQVRDSKITKILYCRFMKESSGVTA